MSQLTIGPSEIHRSGIVAACDIPTGAVLTHEEMVQAAIGFNHSCTANVGPVEKTPDEVPFRRALRDIKAGEELTVDYSAAHTGAKPEPCLCPGCR